MIGTMCVLSVLAGRAGAEAPARGIAAVVRTTDGRAVEGAVVALDAEHVAVETDREKVVLPLSRVVAVSFETRQVVQAMSRNGQHVVCLRDGSRLALRDIRIADDRLHGDGAATGPVSLPLRRVAQVWRPRPEETGCDLERQCERLHIDAERNDVLVVRSPAGQWLAVPGLVRSMAEGEIGLTYAGTETAVPAGSVACVVFAAPGDEGTPGEIPGRVLCADGSSVAATSVALSAEGLAIESPSLGRAVLAPATAAEIRLRRAEAVCLSDVQPAEAEETPFFDDRFPWRRDRGLSGRPLTLAGTTYEKGLALHARSRLTFALGGRFSRLTAVAGIDGDLAVGRAVLSILADGRPLVDRLVLDRAGPPERIAVSLGDSRELAILVDFADGTFGSGARVNLCGAELWPSAGPGR